VQARRARTFRASALPPLLAASVSTALPSPTRASSAQIRNYCDGGVEVGGIFDLPGASDPRAIKTMCSWYARAVVAVGKGKRRELCCHSFSRGDVG